MECPSTTSSIKHERTNNNNVTRSASAKQKVKSAYKGKNTIKFLLIRFNKIREVCWKINANSKVEI